MYLFITNYIHLLKDKLDIIIEEDQINKITKLKTIVDSKKPTEKLTKNKQKNKYIISLSNSLIKTTILKNKIKLKYTNI